MNSSIILGDALDEAKKLDAESIDLIYLDPPFNTGKTQRRLTISTTANPDGDRTGFSGKRYETSVIDEKSYVDYFDDYIGFISPILKECLRIIKPTGSLFVHLDYREVHYVKVEADKIFGRDNFINEIIWSYDFGGRGKRRWPAKHDNILWYAKDKTKYTFNYEQIDRIPYMAPKLAGKAKAEIGKIPTDVWWNTIVPTNSKEKTGYPTQKPLKILNRIILVHSNKGDTILDLFSGSGTTGEAALLNERNFILVDNNLEAIETTKKRLEKYGSISAR